MLEQGIVLDRRYQVESLIAKGGMGSVYLVRDMKLNQKQWIAKEIAQIDNQEAFNEEARILTTLSHPHIPKIVDYFEHGAGGSSYLVMDYIKGKTLQQLFEQASHKLPLQTIHRYMLQLTEILMYLHNQEKPIIFRDLKPSNIMIDEHDNVQLIDFGIARSYDRHKLTDTIQMGTIAFAAPEQFESKQTDPRTDIYAIGTIIFYLLTEGSYFFRNNQNLASALSHVPEEWFIMLDKLLAVNPDDRYQEVREVHEQLRSIVHLKEPKEEPKETKESSITKTMKISPHALSSSGFQTYNNQPSIQSSTIIDEPSSRYYTTQATQTHPALIIYLLDASGSMSMNNGTKSRMEIVMESLQVALKQMVFRSTKGSRISSRYRVSILAYSDEVYDLLGGIQTIDRLMNTGSLPQLKTYRFTDTAKAFLEAEKILKTQLPSMQDCPAPLICHMTDGVYTGEDPEPIARRIMEMRVKDGPVLIENIFISDEVLKQEVMNPHRWQGVRTDTEFLDAYGYKLRNMSSPIPNSYRQMIAEANYNLSKDALLMFPGSNPELVSLGFQMSAATPIY